MLDRRTHHHEATPTTPEQIVRKLREGDRLLNEGKDITGPSPRDRREHLEPLARPVRGHEGRRGQCLRQLEVENGRLKKLLAEAELDKAMLKELAEGNF